MSFKKSVTGFRQINSLLRQAQPITWCLVLNSKYIDVNQICTTESPLNSSNPIDKKELIIILDGVRLQRLKSTKFLGVIIDENLTWKNHIDIYLKLSQKM